MDIEYMYGCGCYYLVKVRNGIIETTVALAYYRLVIQTT